ncbi:MAG: phosphoglycerate kinase [bacterium]
MTKKTIRNIAVDDKTLLVRVDFNVPIEGSDVADDTRIRETLPTIRYALERRAKVVLMSHLGRPKGKPNPSMTLAPVARHLRSLLSAKVVFCDECAGPKAEAAVRDAEAGSVVLLENLRFHPEEEANDATFARALAALGEIWVNDAFGTAHRAHASTAGIAPFVRERVAGLLMEKELDILGGAMHRPEHPFVAIIGGAKISGKIDVITSLLPRVDRLLIGGGMACTFFRAKGWEIGNSLLEEDRVAVAKAILDGAGSEKILLPVDGLVAEEVDNEAPSRVVLANAIPRQMRFLDIGPQTIRSFDAATAGARTILWNGPMGVFEMPSFARGTRGIAEALASATARGATTIVGGGDSARAIAELKLGDKVTHVSTGGGATLEFLEGKTLPGVAALDDAS